MQAVILAAGKSTRTYPLTLTKPKPLLKVANRALIVHNLESLRGIVSEVIIVVGYKKELIKKLLGSNYKRIKIKYVEQRQQLGTAHALSIAEGCINGRFVLMMGDDIYSRKDIENCIKHRYSILVAKVKNPKNFGVVIEKKGILADFVEKPKKFVSDMASTAFYVLDKNIFRFIKQLKKSERGELELPDALKMISKEQEVHCVRSKKWLPIVYAWDLLKADKLLRKSKNIVGSNSKVYGILINSSIGNGCIIKGNVKNSIIMDGSTICDNSVVEDSVIGENVCFDGKLFSKNNVNVVFKDKKIKVERLGAIIGDNSKIIKKKIEAGTIILPCSVIGYEKNK